MGPPHRLSNRPNLLIFKMLILRMKPLSVAVLEGEGRRELEHYNTEQVVSDFEPHRVAWFNAHDERWLETQKPMVTNEFLWPSASFF